MHTFGKIHLQIITQHRVCDTQIITDDTYNCMVDEGSSTERVESRTEP